MNMNNNQGFLIGIAGKARSGKDTSAHLILDILGDSWGKASFADPIKAMLTAIGIDCSDDAKTIEIEHLGVTPRAMMQTLGTEWGRNLINDDMWVNTFSKMHAGKRLIVPDVRFKNEAALIRKHGVLIHIVGRGGIEGSHVSEQPVSIEKGDEIIDNSGGVEGLRWQVENILKRSEWCKY